jgi:hypothetical protein
MNDQFYLFTVPGHDHIWAETFLANGMHFVAPTAFTLISDAMIWMTTRNPGATVDELCDTVEIAQAREWARTMPLEQITA